MLVWALDSNNIISANDTTEWQAVATLKNTKQYVLPRVLPTSIYLYLISIYLCLCLYLYIPIYLYPSQIIRQRQLSVKVWGCLGGRRSLGHVWHYSMLAQTPATAGFTNVKQVIVKMRWDVSLPGTHKHICHLSSFEYELGIVTKMYTIFDEIDFMIKTQVFGSRPTNFLQPAEQRNKLLAGQQESTNSVANSSMKLAVRGLIHARTPSITKNQSPMWVHSCRPSYLYEKYIDRLPK